MEVLENIIRELSSDEVRRFKILSNRFKAEEEKKLLVLFDAIRDSGGRADDTSLLIAVYAQDSPAVRNRYYRLRNKLLDNIEQSLVFYHFKGNEPIQAYYDLQLSALFRQRGEHNLAYFFLKKAEKKAIEQEQYACLDLVYEEMLQISLQSLAIDVEEVIRKRKDNRVQVERGRRNTELIARLTQELKRTNFSIQKNNVFRILERLRVEIEHDQELFTSPAGRIQVIRVVGSVLIQRGEFREVSDYIANQITEFEVKGWFNAVNHPNRLLWRIWMVNALFKQHRFKEASMAIAIFEQEMAMYNGQYKHLYFFHYYNTRINAYIFNGQLSEALRTCNDALRIPELIREPSQEAYLLISRAGASFDLEAFSHALKDFEALEHHPGTSELSEEIRLNIAIFHAVTYTECELHHECLNQVTKVKKNYRALLRHPQHAHRRRFLELVERIAQNAIAGKKVSFRSAADKFIEEHAPALGNDILHYDVYLTAKAHGMPYGFHLQQYFRKLAR